MSSNSVFKKSLSNVVGKILYKKKFVDFQTKFFQNAHEGIVVTNEHNEIIDLNPAFERVTGYSKKELLGKDPSILKSGEHTKEFYEQMWESIKYKGLYKGEVINKKKDGQKYVQNVSIFTLKNQFGEITNYYAMVSDITETFLNRKKLYSLANYDTLTKVYNRHSFYEKLEYAIFENTRHDKKFALIYIDLDNFKNINDSQGHDHGDAYLIKFTKILQRSLRKNDVLARIGGDEFVAILDGLESEECVYPFFQRLFKILQNPIEIQNIAYNLTASFGISIFPDDSICGNDLVKYADLALYESKKNGKNQYTFYNHNFEQKLLDELKLEKDIKKAIEQKEFIIQLQPKIQLADQTAKGVEVLVRWNKDGKLIYPDTFIPFCEKSNLINDIGNEVFDQVIELMKKWDGIEELSNICISFNLSAKQIKNQQFLNKIMANKEFLLSKPSILIAEITEHSIVEDFDQMKKFLEFLQDCNIQIAIDDFGTGYSSLQYLKTLPINYLKIDKAFTLNIFNDPKDMAITKTIITLAQNLELEIIAEGVETQAHADFFNENNCKFAQGYFYSKAIGISEIEKQFLCR